MIRGDYYIRSDKGHLRIKWFPDDGDDEENPTTRNLELIIGSRWLWVTFQSSQLLRDSKWWRNFFFFLPLHSDAEHEILISCFFFSIIIQWWRHDWMGWLLREEKCMTLYDDNGELRRNKFIP